MAKRVILFGEFDIQYVNRKVIKWYAIIYKLDKLPLLDEYPLVMEFTHEYMCMVEETHSCKVYFCGSYITHA